MDKLKHFIDNIVTITYNETRKEYLHYPFTLMATNEHGTELNSLIGLNSQQCYSRFHDYVLKGYKEIMLAMSFPPGFDIDKDFIAVFGYTGDAVQCKAITYDNITGIRLNEYEIKDKSALRLIFFNFFSEYRKKIVRHTAMQN